MAVTDQEKGGLTDLFITETQNQPIIVQLARSESKNAYNIAKPEDALVHILKIYNDTLTILNKRYVTKEVLFKYLNSRNVNVSINFTKLELIQNTLEYWKSKSNNFTAVNQVRDVVEDSNNVLDSNSEKSNDINNLLAHTFSKWFFQRYNEETLQSNDFYADAQLTLELVDGDSINETQVSGATNVLRSLLEIKKSLQLYFHPNIDNNGCQGCADVHGLVIVVICGTLHKQEICNGVFECSIGLLRDPFAENNYKIKTIKSCLRCQSTPPTLSLMEME